MGTFTQRGRAIWRDYATEGVPASGAHKPQKDDIRQWALEVEDQVAPVTAGLPYLWETSTSGDPGAGHVAGNHATPASITSLRVSLIGEGAQSFAALIGTWDDSAADVLGVLTIFAAADRTKWISADVTALSVGAYATLTLANVSAGAAFAADDLLGITYARSAEGQGYAATSTTSLAIGTGSKSCTIQPHLAYAAGLRVRLAHDATHYMDGIVSSYDAATGAMAVTVDHATGSGTYTSWNVGVVGEPGDAVSATTVADVNAALASAITARDTAIAQASTATTQATLAKAAYEATGLGKYFDTYAAANTGIGSVSNGAVVCVGADETRGGLTTLYVKESGAYVYKLPLTFPMHSLDSMVDANVAKEHARRQPIEVPWLPDPTVANGRSFLVTHRTVDPVLALGVANTFRSISGGWAVLSSPWVPPGAAYVFDRGGNGIDNGASTSSVAVGTGAKSFAAETGRSWNGKRIRVYSTATPTTYMEGPCTYDSATGVISLTADASSGSGTLSSWAVRICGRYYWNGAVKNESDLRTVLISGLPRHSIESWDCTGGTGEHSFVVDFVGQETGCYQISDECIFSLANTGGSSRTELTFVPGSGSPVLYHSRTGTGAAAAYHYWPAAFAGQTSWGKVQGRGPRRLSCVLPAPGGTSRTGASSYPLMTGSATAIGGTVFTINRMAFGYMALNGLEYHPWQNDAAYDTLRVIGFQYAWTAAEQWQVQTYSETGRPGDYLMSDSFGADRNYAGTSATSITVGTGSQTFVVPAAYAPTAGEHIRVCSTAIGEHTTVTMFGTVTSVTSAGGGNNNVVVNVTSTAGAGTTRASWSLYEVSADDTVVSMGPLDRWAWETRALGYAPVVNDQCGSTSWSVDNAGLGAGTFLQRWAARGGTHADHNFIALEGVWEHAGRLDLIQAGMLTVLEGLSHPRIILTDTLAHSNTLLTDAAYKTQLAALASMSQWLKKRLVLTYSTLAALAVSPGDDTAIANGALPPSITTDNLHLKFTIPLRTWLMQSINKGIALGYVAKGRMW